MKPKLLFFTTLACTILLFACDQKAKEEKMSPTTAVDILAKIDTLSNKKLLC
jgi:outer membrane murein-binding lipoprotein Lpp